jgi:hypothetical protein
LGRASRTARICSDDVTRTQGEERQTLVVASADYDPDASEVSSRPATLTSPSGKRRYKNHDKPGEPLESTILNDPTQLSWIMQRRLQRLQYGTTLDRGDGQRSIGLIATSATGVLFTTH